jgi:hypothetical protein
MTEYPRDMIVLYAQGYSVTDYLVRKGGDGQEGRQKLLRFLAEGMNGNTPESWSGAAQRVYGFDSVESLEAAWLDALRTPPTRVAARTNGNAPGATTGGKGTDYAATGGARGDLRSSAPPAMPLLDPPVKVRGATPSEEPTRPTSMSLPSSLPVSAAPVSRPSLAPDIPPPALLGPPELPRPVGIGR